jgi:hypothetical protein
MEPTLAPTSNLDRLLDFQSLHPARQAHLRQVLDLLTAERIIVEALHVTETSLRLDLYQRETRQYGSLVLEFDTAHHWYRTAIYGARSPLARRALASIQHRYENLFAPLW